MPSIPVEEIWMLIHIGLMLFFGFLAGTIITLIRVPRVTGYLLAGLLIGPSGIGLIGGGALAGFDIIAQLALGLIMFNIGGHFRASEARRFARKHLTVAAFEMGLTWLFVGLITWMLSRDATLALMVGFIAMATAPATTLVVVKEYEAEGSLTSNLIALVGINNFLCLALFPFLIMVLVGGAEGDGFTVLSVGKSLLVGVGLGLILSIFEERTTAPNQQMALGLCFVVLVIGLSYAFEGSGSLAALVMGVTKVNSSPRGPTLFERLDSGAYPFYVLFFVIAGANLHIETLLKAGLLGVAYIVFRSAAKIAGAALGAHIAGLSRELKQYLGPAMISHAGVAIGLAMAVGRIGSPSGELAKAIVLGSIVIYEVIGPLTVRFALVRCGEVKMVSLLPHLPGQSGFENLERILSQIRRSLGLPVRGFGQTGESPVVKHVMRSSVETVPYNARFDELLKIVSHARYDLLPVVDKDGNYMGNISFPGIRDVIFDETLADLVIAQDLLDYEPTYVTPEEPLGAVLQKFHDIREEIGCLPVVVEGENRRVIGMIRQRDVVDVFRRIRTTK